MKSKTSIELTIQKLKERVEKNKREYEIQSQPPFDYEYTQTLLGRIHYDKGWIDALEEVVKD